MKTGPIIFLLALGALTALLVSGCSSSSKDSVWHKKQAYIDARLQFSISYPQSWGTSQAVPDLGSYSVDSVSWEIRNDELNDQDDLVLTVVSLPRSGVITGPDVLDEVLTDIYPNLTFTDRKNVEIPAGSAIMLTGHTPQTTFRGWSISGNKRDYLLIAVSSPEKFNEYLPLFEEVTESFRIWGEQEQ